MTQQRQLPDKAKIVLEFPGAEIVEADGKLLVGMSMNEGPVPLLVTLRNMRDCIDQQVEQLEAQLTVEAVMAARLMSERKPQPRKPN